MRRCIPVKIREAFSKEEEQDFSKEEQGLNPPHIRWMFLLFIILYAFFALTDFFYYPDEWQKLFIVRFVIVIPLLILVILLSYKQSLSKYHQYYIAFSFFVGGAGITYMLILYPENIIYYGGLFLVYFSGYLLVRLRFYYATFSGLAILLFHIIGHIIINNELSETVLFGLLFYIGANLIGMVGAYHLEVKNRKQFIYNRDINQKNSELKQQYKERDEQFNKLEQSIKENDALKLLTKSLKESEEKYRDLFEQSVMAIFVHDMEGQIINVNNRACLQLKYTKEELLKLSIFDLHPSDADTINQPKDEILRQWKCWQKNQQNIIEAEHQCKDGTIIPVRISTGAVEHKEGKQILAVVQDITEITIATNKLKQRNALIEGLFNHMTSGVAIYEVINDGLRGSDYIIKEFNETSLGWENKSRDEVVGKAISELHPNIDDSGIIDFFRKVWKTGEPIIFPAKQYVNGNYNRWHENRIFKLPSGEIVAMYDDITERVLVENRLAKERRDLLTSQKIAKLGTWRLDLKTKEISMSKELYKMHGFDPNKPVPPYEEHMKLFTKRSRDQLETALELTRTKGTPYELELEMVIEGEPQGWMWTRGEAEYDDQGHIVSLTGAAQNITKRKQLEHNLKEAHQIAKLGRWELIHNNNQLDWSETIFDIFEIDSNRFESSYEGFLKVIHPDDRSTVDEAFKRSLFDKQAYSIEHRLLMDDGRIKWVSEKCRTEFDEKGKPIRSVGVVQDITESKQQEAEIIHASNHDYLTEIPNRRYYQEMLQKYDNKEYYPLGIIIMDMNGLKLINDAFGHSVGNEALKLCSNTLNETKRDKDFLARIGGDEFAIICPNIKVTEMEKLVDKIDKEVSKKSIKNIELSLAIGYEIKQDKKKSIRTTLINAEDYMYRKKVLTKHTDKNDMIQSILNTLTEKYNEEKVHSERVSKYCKAVGEAMQLRKDEITELELAGMVHDIGKISLPDAILKKPGKLTEKEWEIIRNHTVNGYQILRAADKYSNIAEFAMSHHERMDGKGYPNGLKGEEIPLFSRIISVADAYEAMTSDRPYRKAMKKQEAIEELKKHSGTQFDSGIVELFIDKVLAR